MFYVLLFIRFYYFFENKGIKIKIRINIWITIEVILQANMLIRYAIAYFDLLIIRVSTDASSSSVWPVGPPSCPVHAFN